MAYAAGGCAAAAVPSGSEAYAKLYPEKSSDNVLRLGNVVPGEWNGLDITAAVRPIGFTGKTSVPGSPFPTSGWHLQGNGTANLRALPHCANST